jgi:hypothetical protein
VPLDIYFPATGQRSLISEKYLYFSISCDGIQNKYSAELPNRARKPGRKTPLEAALSSCAAEWNRAKRAGL